MKKLITLVILISSTAFASFEGPLVESNRESVDGVITGKQAIKCTSSNQELSKILVAADERDAFTQYVNNATFLKFAKKDGRVYVKDAGNRNVMIKCEIID